MGLIYTNIKLSNPVNNQLGMIETKALVDTGAMFLCIPEHIAIQLNLSTLEKREITVADGSQKICDYVGPVKISFENRQCFVGALVLGNSVLLGAIPIEDMDLIIHPAQLRLMVNPQNPNIAGTIVMHYTERKQEHTI